MVRMKVLLQLCIVGGMVLMGIGEEDTEEDKEMEEKEVHNPRLDIALLYDESGSMTGTWDKSQAVWNGMQEWIEDYFANSSVINVGETQFAVMGCGHSDIGGGDVGAILHFDGKGSVKGETALAKVFAAQDEVRNRTSRLSRYDNVNGCADSAAKKIFDSSKGDRADAENVALYISDCMVYETHAKREQLKAMRELRQKINKFLFVCTSDNYKSAIPLSPGNIGGYWALLKWVDNDTSLIFNYTTKPDLVKKLNEILPRIKINVTHCKLNPVQRYSYTECALNSNGSCTKIKYPNIIKFPDPPQHGKKCQANATEQCDESECATSMSTTSGVLSQFEIGTTAGSEIWKSKETISGISTEGKVSKDEGIGTIESVIFTQSTAVGERGKEGNFSIGGSTDTDQSTSVGGDAGKTEHVTTVDDGPGKGKGTGESTDFKNSTGVDDHGKMGDVSTIGHGPDKNTETGITEAVRVVQSTSAGKVGKGENYSTIGSEPDKGTDTINPNFQGDRGGGNDATEPSDSSNTPAIVGGIIAGLLVLLLVVIVAVVLIRRQKKAATKGKQADAKSVEMKSKGKGAGMSEMKQSDKDRSMAVDIAEVSRGPSQSKTSESVIGKSDSSQYGKSGMVVKSQSSQLGKSNKSIGGKGAKAKSSASQKQAKDTAKKASKTSVKK